MFKLEERYFVLNLRSNRFNNVRSLLSGLTPAIAYNYIHRFL